MSHTYAGNISLKNNAIILVKAKDLQAIKIPTAMQLYKESILKSADRLLMYIECHGLNAANKQFYSIVTKSSVSPTGALTNMDVFKNYDRDNANRILKMLEACIDQNEQIFSNHLVFGGEDFYCVELIYLLNNQFYKPVTEVFLNLSDSPEENLKLQTTIQLLFIDSVFVQLHVDDDYSWCDPEHIIQLNKLEYMKYKELGLRSIS